MALLGFVVITKDPSELDVDYYPTLEGAQKGMKTGKEIFEAGEYYSHAEVSLCAMLADDVWICPGEKGDKRQ